MFKYLTKLWNKYIRPPEQYTSIANQLSNGVQFLRVNYWHPTHRYIDRYYYGTGRKIKNGFGRNTIYDIKVAKTVTSQDNLTSIEYLGRVDLVDDEMDLLVVECPHTRAVETKRDYYTDKRYTLEQVIGYLSMIVRRLKPGQGYTLNNFEITTDFIHPDGYVIYYKDDRRLIPIELMNSGMISNGLDIDEPFDQSKVFVKDESKIKRQHRSPKDLLRWIVLTEVNSVTDDWVFKFTNANTATGSIKYYRLKIDIDHKVMYGHPFYITQLLQCAVDQLREKHPNTWIEVRTDQISIDWDGKSEKLPTWLKRVERYPLTLDKEPNIIFTPIVPTYTHRKWVIEEI